VPTAATVKGTTAYLRRQGTDHPMCARALPVTASHTGTSATRPAGAALLQSRPTGLRCSRRAAPEPLPPATSG
jgi:hypothetical protein